MLSFFQESCELFTSLYRTWSHSPIATIALCLLTGCYRHAGKKNIIYLGYFSVDRWFVYINHSNFSFKKKNFFQWVPLYLIFLSVLFYMPRCFWLMMEGGLMKFFGKGTTTRWGSWSSLSSSSSFSPSPPSSSWNSYVRSSLAKNLKQKLIHHHPLSKHKILPLSPQPFIRIISICFSDSLRTRMKKERN